MKLLSKEVKWLGFFKKEQIYGGSEQSMVWDKIMQISGMAGKKGRAKKLKALKDKGWKVEKVK